MKTQEILIPAGRVYTRYSISPRTLTRWINNRQFPKPVLLNGRRFFVLDELEAWEEARLAARGKEAM